MSDCIEVDGKKYYEESYLQLANTNAKRGEQERRRLLALLQKADEAFIRYGFSVDDEAPPEHRKLMRDIREAIGAGQEVNHG